MKLLVTLLLLFFSNLSFSNDIIKLVVSSGAGGLIHQYALKLSPVISKETGKKVIIELRPGAEGHIAASYVHQHRKQDETVLLIGTPQRWKNIANSKISHLNDFELVSFLGCTPTLLASNVLNHNSSLSEFLNYSLTKKVTYATSSTNPIRPLLTELIEKHGNKNNFVEVTYKSTAEAVSAVLGNHVDFSAISPENVLEHVEANRLKIIGLVASEKTGVLKNFKKISEQKIEVKDEFKYYPNVFLWSNLSADEDEVKKIRKAIVSYLTSKESQEMRESMHLSFDSKKASNAREHLKQILE